MPNYRTDRLRSQVYSCLSKSLIPKDRGRGVLSVHSMRPKRNGRLVNQGGQRFYGFNEVLPRSTYDRKNSFASGSHS